MEYGDTQIDRLEMFASPMFNSTGIVLHSLGICIMLAAVVSLLCDIGAKILGAPASMSQTYFSMFLWLFFNGLFCSLIGLGYSRAWQEGRKRGLF